MKLTCKICNCDVEATAFGMHLKHKHKIGSEEYYKAYVKNTSGICRCGKPLKFMGVLRGYKQYCSPKCALHKYTYNGLNFDSASELAYFIWLSDNDAHFEYQPKISFAYTYNGKTHAYHPDFIVENTFVEIKGAHFFENGKMINPYDRTQDGLYEAKHQCMLDNSVKIVTDYDEYIKYVNDKYTKNYLSAFKNN